MNTNRTPEEICLDVMRRSTCSVQVGAVLVDAMGILGWGWNHAGFTGMGEHAEVNALKRTNYHRQIGSTIYVASQRNRNQKAITSKPCERCQGWLEARGVSTVWWRGGDNLWHRLDL